MFSKDLCHGVDDKIMQKITANMQDNSFVTHFINMLFTTFLFQLQCHWLIQWNGIFFFSVIALCELQATEATADQCMCEEKTSDSYWVQEKRSRCCDNFERSVCDCKRKKRGSRSLPVCSTGIFIVCMLIFKEKAIMCLVSSNVSIKYHQCSQILCNLRWVVLFLQHRFYFDHVFGEESTNEEVYRKTAYPLVQHMLHR